MIEKSTNNNIIFRKGKTIYLRPISTEDTLLLTKWINDFEMTKFLNIIYPRTVDDELRWVENLSLKKTDIVLAISTNRTNKLLGLIGLHNIDHIHRTATVSIAIGDQLNCDKGYGSEAIKIIIEYAFKTLNIRKVCASALDFNTRSINCLSKCGFKKEGFKKEQFYKNGKYVDEIQMAIFDENFYENKKEA